MSLLIYFVCKKKIAHTHMVNQANSGATNQSLRAKDYVTIATTSPATPPVDVLSGRR